MKKLTLTVYAPFILDHDVLRKCGVRHFVFKALDGGSGMAAAGWRRRVRISAGPHFGGNFFDPMSRTVSFGNDWSQ